MFPSDPSFSCCLWLVPVSAFPDLFQMKEPGKMLYHMQSTFDEPMSSLCNCSGYRATVCSDKMAENSESGKWQGAALLFVSAFIS